MILTTLIILILIGCFINGHRKGLIMMVLYTGAYIVSWLAAKTVAPLLGTWLSHLLPNVTDEASYSSAILSAVDTSAFFSRGIAFLLVFTAVSIICHWGIRQLRWIKRVPVIGTVDRLAGGALSLVIGYIIIFLVLVVTQLWPAGWWQMQIANSGLARLIINQTPVLAHLLLQTIG
ncbi:MULTISPECIES: CvpA family protein [Limosilactobacillus]|uniref:Cvpa family protein n=1 Tax=Limosilactobacillus panis DSM 6035 TaxID=1423782 RepID=A0A0R1XEP9_9LACO|nr:CvpA family protein [Limosilactobacillus panis]KRM26964.1 cvpa family protein [Limosilactobacillus panis DSM 6035]